MGEGRRGRTERREERGEKREGQARTVGEGRCRAGRCSPCLSARWTAKKTLPCRGNERRVRVFVFVSSESVNQ